MAGTTSLSADLCIDSNSATILGLYRHSESQSSAFYVFQGRTMQSELEQRYRYGGLGNGEGGKCPEHTDALLSIQGKYLGDTEGVFGYCLKKNLKNGSPLK